MEQIITTLWITFGLYMLVLVAILADLWSGVRKAKRRGILRSSTGLRRTIEKIAKYYNTLLALTVIDAMQMGAVFYLDCYYSWKWPFFPFITLFGAIALALVEVKSIYEKAEDKVQIDNIVSVAGKVIKNRKDVQEVLTSIMKYLQSDDEEILTDGKEQLDENNKMDADNKV